MDEYKPNVFSSFPNGISQQLEMVNPTYDQMIIKPPEKNKTHGKRSVRVIVDSRTRDKILYPDPSKYLMKLEYEHQDVVSIELTQANIPNTFYNVYEQYDNNGNLLYANNRIYFYDDEKLDGMVQMSVVKPGKYTDPCEFVNALNGVAGGKFIPVPGGVLIIRDNEIVGAVGVSGDTSDNDEHVAILGIRAAGLKSSPSNSVPEKTEKSNL